MKTLRCTTLMLVFLLFVSAVVFPCSAEPYVALTSATSDAPENTRTFRWPRNKLASLIPKPDTLLGEVIKSDKNQIRIVLDNYSHEDFYTYIDACIELGFSDILEESTNEFKALNLEGYSLTLSYEEDNSMLISLDEPVFNVTVTIDCIGNFLFNKYDVEVFLDGEEVGFVSHGGEESFQLNLKEGSYTLEVRKKSWSTPKGSVLLNVTESAIIEYEVVCYGEYVDIEQDSYLSLRPLGENELRILQDANDYKYEHFSDVVDSLTELGFSQIKTTILYDIVLGWTDEGEVANVSIDGIKDFKSGDIFNKDAEVIVTYHMLEDDDPARTKMKKAASSYEGMNYKDARKAFEKLGFTNIVCEEQTTDDTTYKDGEVYRVTIDYEHFDVGDAYLPNDRVIIKYYTLDIPETKPQITIPLDSGNLSEQHYSKAVEALEKSGFSIQLEEFETYNQDITPDTVCSVVFESDDIYLDKFSAGDTVDNDVVAVVTYWKVLEIDSEYELAFVRRLKSYNLYYMFDRDTKTVVYFGTDDTYLYKAKYTGDFSSGVKIAWKNGLGTEKFKYREGTSQGILIDGNGYSWEYSPCDIMSAQKVLNQRQSQ